MKRLELTGRRFGRWNVIRFVGVRNSKTYWWCRCSCGRTAPVSTSNLTCGYSRRCFACARAVTGASVRTHGMSGSVEFRAWSAMKNRCGNSKFRDWKYYGGRGVRVCCRWLRSFSAFYSDMGKRPRGKSLDRRNPYGNYTPGNCRWATALTQSRNQRRRCKR